MAFSKNSYPRETSQMIWTFNSANGLCITRVSTYTSFETGYIIFILRKSNMKVKI